MHQLNVAVIADFEIVKQEQAMWLKGLTVHPITHFSKHSRIYRTSYIKPNLDILHMDLFK